MSNRIEINEDGYGRMSTERHESQDGLFRHSFARDEPLNQEHIKRLRDYVEANKTGAVFKARYPEFSVTDKGMIEVTGRVSLSNIADLMGLLSRITGRHIGVELMEIKKNVGTMQL